MSLGLTPVTKSLSVRTSAPTGGNAASVFEPTAMELSAKSFALAPDFAAVSARSPLGQIRQTTRSYSGPGEELNWDLLTGGQEGVQTTPPDSRIPRLVPKQTGKRWF